MKFINYTIVRFSVFLTLGILSAQKFPLPFLVLIPLAVSFLFVVALWIIAKRQFIQTVFFGISIYSCFFIIGYFLYQTKQPAFDKNHYSHVSSGENQLIQLKIREILKPDIYNEKYYASVLSVDSIDVKGKILVLIPKDSLTPIFSPDDILVIHTSFSDIPKPLNPTQFDYAAYMKNQEVFSQIRIITSEILYAKKGKRTLFGMAQNLRQKFVIRLQQSTISKDESSIIQALILGDKTEIDKQLYEAYAAAGAVHILAVSGLHVGILFVILSFLLRPLNSFKYGKIIQSLLIVLLLWSFALIAGFSPSVVRSVSMFSFFAFALLLGRRTNAVNTLFLSYFFLLLVNPLWLFQVGFQLSYAAVFFILWTQPIFDRMGYAKYYFIREFRGLITVSLSAQIGVLPLTLFYFNQFPGLFLVTNLVVLPALTIFMIGGILVVVLAFYYALPNWMATGYNMMIEKLNSFIEWISLRENFVFSEIYFSAPQAMAAYFLIFSCILWLRKTTFSGLILVLTGITLFLGVSIYDKKTAASSELVFFHKNRSTILAIKNGQHLTLLTRDSMHRAPEEFPVKSYKVKNNIRSVESETLPEVFRYNNRTVLVLDSLGTIPKNGKIDILLLTNSPKINLRRMIDSLQPEHIIADGSNYPSLVRQWRTQSANSTSMFHYTGEEGAFLMK